MTTQPSFKKIIIALGVVIALIFGCYYLVYRDIEAKNLHVSRLTNGLSTLTGKQEYLSTTTAYLKSIDDDVKNITNSVVPKGEDVKFIDSLESLARNEGLNVTIDSLLFADDKKADANGVMVLNVKAETMGTWVGTYTFLAKLESLPLKIKINNVTIKDSITSVSTDPEHAARLTDKWQSVFEITVLKYK